MPPIGERVAALETKVDAYHAEVLRVVREELGPMKKEIDRHSSQITFWKGAIAILSFIWAGALAFFGIHHR